MNLHNPFIAMTTYNRPEYFKSTIASLLRSNVGINNFYIFDDCSTDEQKKKDLMYFDQWRIFSNTENSGSYITTVQAINYVFSKTDDNSIILLQDDVLFSKNWYENVMRIFKLAISEYNNIALFSFWSLNQIERKRDYYTIDCGSVGFPGVIIMRWFWGKLMESIKKPIEKSNNHKLKHWADVKICNIAVKLNYIIGITSKSYIQHIGENSAVSDKKNEFCTVSNFVGENF